LLKRRNKSIDLLPCVLPAKVKEGIGPNQPYYPFRHLPGGLYDYRPSHRMAYEDDLAKVEFLDDRCDVFAESLHSPVMAAKAGLPMAGKVDGHDFVPLCKVGRLKLPIGSITAPAMNKYEGRLAFTLYIVTYGDIV
jgi:hypothetical protein